MRWYDGGIAEAVATSKTRNAIFVVYVEGTDEQSKCLTSILNDDSISSKLESCSFVALKLEAGSTPHSQFAEIYKNVAVPSIFFIGKTGLPLDIIISGSNIHEISERIEKIIQSHGNASSVKSATQSEVLIAQEQQATSQSQEEMPTEIIEDKKAEDMSENGVGFKAPEKVDPMQEATLTLETSKPNEDSIVETSKEEQSDREISRDDPVMEISVEEELALEKAKEEKIQHAKDLVEKQREVKKLEEEEVERQKELERRKTGQDVQKLKRWQQDQELKDLMEERKREKNEEKAARDRILAQIAQDKADRAAKFAPSTPSNILPTEPAKPNVSPPLSNVARLQFRLPNGTSSTASFESYKTLQDVRTYITENLSLPFRNFTLATTFPRREFTSDDYLLTMHDLELCPTAVIMIIPAPAHVALNNPGGSIGIMFWTLLSPIFSIFGYFRNLIFGPRQRTGNPTQPDRNKRVAGENIDPNQQPSSVKRRVTETSSVRKQGNIHRFTDKTDSDDDNNTWNGNSTQQM